MIKLYEFYMLDRLGNILTYEGEKIKVCFEVYSREHLERLKKKKGYKIIGKKWK